jgi:hypothetical protein
MINTNFEGTELEAAVVFYTVVGAFYDLQTDTRDTALETGACLLADAVLRHIWPALDLQMIGPNGQELRRCIARAAVHARRLHGIAESH